MTTLAIWRIFAPVEPTQQRLWLHAIQVAYAARFITKATSSQSRNSESAYLAGLLHDIGRFIMFEKAPEFLRMVEINLWDTPHALLLADIEVFHFAHSRLGYLACRKWGFHHEILETVSQHHRYFGVHQSGLTKELEELLIIVQIADHLSNLILHPTFARNDAAAQAQLIRDNCLRPEWGWLPIDEQFLQKASISIGEEAQHLARCLNVA